MPPLGSTFGLVNEYAYGRAWTQRSLVPQPAVASGFTYKIGGDHAERPVAVTFQLATDANAGNRPLRLSYQDAGGNEYAFAVGNVVQTAGLTWRWCFALGFNLASPASSLAVVGQLPSLFMQPGDVLVLVVGGVQAGDQVSKAIVTSEMFGTSQRDFPPGQGPELAPAAARRDQVAPVY